MMDRAKQHQIWQRVYGQQQSGRRYSRRELEQCYQRELASHRYYDRCREDPVYGAAFARLADEALEHCNMLQSILRR